MKYVLKLKNEDTYFLKWDGENPDFTNVKELAYDFGNKQQVFFFKNAISYACGREFEIAEF